MDQRVLPSVEIAPSSSFVEVAVNAPLSKPLLYTPNSNSLSLQRGQRVIVPLGKKRTTTGVVLGFRKQAGPYKMKSILSLDSSPPLHEEFLKWLQWISHYYLHPIGQVLALSFLPLKKKKTQDLDSSEVILSFQKNLSLSSNVKDISLNEEQTKCIQQIRKTQNFKVHLLYGVTGSGKTEVYLSLIESTLKQGKKALVLVPEISLTPQLLRVFSFRFPNQIAILHSSLRPQEKRSMWKAVLKGERKVLIGARSALFCPLHPLGLIVVDEEHEGSFKQSSQFKYHARDTAIMLAKFYNCPIVLGSATPSMESWKKTEEKKYELHKIKKRIFSSSLPQIHIVDMRKEKRTPDKMQERKKIEKQVRKKESKKISSLPSWMSDFLYKKLCENLSKKEQSALFLNRRGMASLSFCQNCGYVFECPNCAVHLTLHQSKELICHYCDYIESSSETCPKCKKALIKALGLGTEKIEKDLKKLFPHIKTLRADRDEVSSIRDLELMIQNMEKKDQVDILIGTQMIAKGLNFPYLTLVGFVLADIGFNLPDFRASEKSFQLITQMSGRPGRFSRQKSQVIIQAFNPHHISLVFAQENNYEDFAKEELSYRKRLQYPPYGRLALFKVQGSDEKITKKASTVLKETSLKVKKYEMAFSSLQVLGPSPSPLSKLKGKYRFHLLVKALSPFELNAFCEKLSYEFETKKKNQKLKVQLTVDIDPVHML